MGAVVVSGSIGRAIPGAIPRLSVEAREQVLRGVRDELILVPARERRRRKHDRARRARLVAQRRAERRVAVGALVVAQRAQRDLLLRAARGLGVKTRGLALGRERGLLRAARRLAHQAAVGLREHVGAGLVDAELRARGGDSVRRARLLADAERVAQERDLLAQRRQLRVRRRGAVRDLDACAVRGGARSAEL